VEGGKIKILRGDNTGTVKSVNADLIRFLLKEGYLPVITIPIEAEDGGALNADADRVAASVAVSMEADTLVLLTNRPGLLKDPENNGSLIRKVARNEIESAMEYAQGRMKKKVLAAKEAISGGINRVIIADANSEIPLTSALNGEGTHIC
jgi:acetylglutamate/LysW-gamma-L-alpha-aminoadipate kinase